MLPTPGGARLRGLRQQAGRSQLWVETEAGLGTGYLQRVESGRVAHPERATLERVLTALAARYAERRDVLDAFGYAMPTPLPTEDETAWARLICARELAQAPFPAYTLDCAHRLVAWNGAMEALLGASGFAGRCILALWFDPGSALGRLLAEPDELLPAMMRAHRFEARRYAAEPWHQALTAELLALPAFRHHWHAALARPEVVSAARALVPLRLRRGEHTLAFRLSSEPFLRDDRFRIVYLLPADAATLAWGTLHGAA